MREERPLDQELISIVANCPVRLDKGVPAELAWDTCSAWQRVRAISYDAPFGIVEVVKTIEKMETCVDEGRSLTWMDQRDISRRHGLRGVTDGESVTRPRSIGSPELDFNTCAFAEPTSAVIMGG